MWISRAMNRTLSGSMLTKRTRLSATILPLCRSRALYTLLYVPCPILSSRSNVSARRGSHPSTISPATDVSHEGHPAMTCSPENPCGTLEITCACAPPPQSAAALLFPPMSSVAHRWCVGAPAVL